MNVSLHRLSAPAENAAAVTHIIIIHIYIYILIVEKFACFSSSLWAGEGIDRHLMQFNNVLSLERNIPEDQILLSFGPHAACQLKNEILVDSCILSKDLK